MNTRLAVARKTLQEAEQLTGVRGVQKYDLPEYLSPVFLQGITHGTVIEVSGSLAIATLIAGITAGKEGWVTCVGIPAWSWDIAVASLSLRRCILIPRVPHNAALVLSSLVNGCDVSHRTLS